MHKNKHKLPHNALSQDDIKNVTTYIKNHAEENAVSLPGRIPGYKTYQIQLLPSSTTKRSIHDQYQAAAIVKGHRCVGYTTFCGIWTKYVPHVVVAKPRTDLCWQCMKNNNRILRAQNISEEMKTEVPDNLQLNVHFDSFDNVPFCRPLKELLHIWSGQRQKDPTTSQSAMRASCIMKTSQRK